MAPRSTRTRDLTEAELLLLGLVAEMPRHGYELEREIERRALREWTRIGFSSVYYVLGQLERAGLVRASRAGGAKARKTYEPTALGRRALVARTRQALGSYRPTHSSLLVGMLHGAVLTRDEVLSALAARGAAVAAERERLAGIQLDQQPLPDFVEALFDFSLGQLAAEAEWIERTLDYMRTKPWPEE